MIGATSFGMSRPSYWLSASVLTITSAPSFRAASRPAWKPFASPLLFVRRTMWSTPFSRATSIVRSVEPSSMIEPLDDVEAGHLAGEVAQRDRERLLLVQAGDLDDELHGAEGVKATIGAVMSRLRDEGPALAVLGLMMVAGLVLRVLHNDHGLPYVYYVDEGSHFTKRAVEVFRDANPGYFQNPSAYTYLLHLVYRAVALPFGGGETVIEGYRTNAEWVFEISRGLAARAVPRRRRPPCTPPGGSCGTAAPASSPRPCSASRSCRSPSRAWP